ncbi:type II toxin-antitoxin system RelE/ParE family toxin [Bacillota bacterium LCP21S3_G6]
MWNWLEDLRIKGRSVKDARIQYKQVLYSIQLLADNGTMLPDTIVKHLDEDIWELRPGNNRVLFFFKGKGCGYVLLHHFRKKTQKTPIREIIKAKAERDDYLQRNKDW